MPTATGAKAADRVLGAARPAAPRGRPGSGRSLCARLAGRAGRPGPGRPRAPVESTWLGGTGSRGGEPCSWRRAGPVIRDQRSRRPPSPRRAAEGRIEDRLHTVRTGRMGANAHTSHDHAHGGACRRVTWRAAGKSLGESTSAWPAAPAGRHGTRRPRSAQRGSGDMRDPRDLRDPPDRRSGEASRRGI